jgi:hypothetical protein
MPLSRELLFVRVAIWLRGPKRLYLVLGGIAVGRGFESFSLLKELTYIHVELLVEWNFI